jgi:hypothetical protein
MASQNGWSGLASARPGQLQGLSADQQARLTEALQTEPQVEVTVRVFGTDKGQAEIRVRPNPQGAFAALFGTGQARAAAWAQLLTIVQREVQSAFQPGSLGGVGPARPQ